MLYAKIDVLNRLKMNSREEVIRFLKSMWNEEPQPCPYCGGKLNLLHKKAKKDTSDWICTECGRRFDAIKILNELNEGL